MGGSLHQQFPVTPVSRPALPLSYSGDPVVDHFCDLERYGFPWAPGGALRHVLGVNPVPWVDFHKSGSVFLVIASFYLLYGLLVVDSGLLVMFPPWI